jgi:two-component system, OmpR family, heavy metal sensor histidine kinase CusS
MIRSFRLRLLLHTSLAAVVMLGLLGTVLYVIMRQSMESDYNQGLLTEARAVAATTEQHGSRVIFDFAPQQLPQFVSAGSPDYFQAWIDPNIVIRSPSLKDADLPRPASSGEIGYQDVVLPDGRPGRTVALPFSTAIEPNAAGNMYRPRQSRNVLLVVAGRTAALDAALSNLAWLLLGSCLLAVVLSGIVLVWIVGRAVRPLERVAHDIDELRENDLSVRLRTGGVPLELEPVVEKLNGLLSRIEAAFMREKSFTADVAHELRTPVAALLTTVEVCRSRSRDEAAYLTAIEKCHNLARRMQAMVESLLLLARAEAGQLAVKLQPTDVADLIDDCWAFFSHRAENSRITLQWHVDGPISIDTDPEKLRIVFDNLFDNAVSYADDGGSIRVTAELRDNEFRAEVANTGSHVSAEQVTHLFERFWRGDKARADAGMHCGLGLSLCQRLVRLLSGRLEVQTAAGGWFSVKLALPRGRVERPVSNAVPLGSAA